MKHLARVAALFVALLPLTGCLDSMVKPEASVDPGIAAQLPPYDGPRAKAAVTNFDWSVGQNKTTIGVAGTDFSFSQSEYAGYSDGLRDMLTTSLVQSKRYRVLERQRLDAVKDEIALSEDGYTDSSGVKRGNVKGADIAVIAAVTGFDPATKGTGGSIGGGLLGSKATALLGGLTGAYKESSIAMDIRIVDVATSEVLAATRVEGKAKDANIGVALGAITGSGALGGSLGTFAKTPMEKAIRTCIYEATKYIVENTPQEYMIH
jgi:curli biogenesis system outer membrane secretion channel CsgG